MEQKLQDEALLSNTIDWLRLPLIIGVVFIHINPKVDIQQVNYLSMTGFDVYTIIATWGSHVFTAIAVPCFFLFSGFFFFYKTEEWNKSIYIEKIKSRVKTLIIPYLLWNVIAVSVILLLKLVKFDGSASLFLNKLINTGLLNIFWNYHKWGTTTTNILGWTTPYDGPYNVPLWYIRDLIICIIFSPLIYYLIKHTKQYVIALLAILYFAKIWVLMSGFSITAFFFFSLGAFFSILDKNIVIEFRKNKIVWLLVALSFMAVSTYYDGTKMVDYFLPIYVVSGTITIINIVSYLIEKKYAHVNSHLVNSSFFIYTTHTILILACVGNIFDYVFKSKDFFILILRYFTVPIGSVLVCYWLYLLMKKTIPNVLQVLTGNR